MYELLRLVLVPKYRLRCFSLIPKVWKNDEGLDKYDETVFVPYSDAIADLRLEERVTANKKYIESAALYSDTTIVPVTVVKPSTEHSTPTLDVSRNLSPSPPPPPSSPCCCPCCVVLP